MIRDRLDTVGSAGGAVFDYHVHSTFSVDCRVPIETSCEAAIAAGVTEIAFTDHVDHEPSDPGHGFYRYGAYREAIERARAHFGDRLTILAGAEVDFNRRIADQVEAFLDQTEFDFVIGSVHFDVDGQLIYPRTFTGRTLGDVFRPYFADILAAVETGWFDTIGHLDLPKRYTPGTHRDYDPLTFRDALEPIFAAMIRHGVAFEINTSGMRQVPRASMPGPAVVRWYAEAGGTLITTGTDSHAAQTIGAGLETTLAMLELCGIAGVRSFRARRGTTVPIRDLIPAPIHASGPA
ncbi:MAG: Histidinol-phosphatase [uncultured Thermomicrobiales bacterium]|uniref:Histidinol-phosphatase n=1 Tax=uncultured Thermomicrobiales bacterium TaxID=1645740 RepID=A0A6J4V085_9BACT|nr:MAG: Histidinol-phosphatase [uncultured Thermomicrobiales bacterium]